MKALIYAVWFGKLPWSFNAWLKSVRYNNSIDFCLVTDQKVETDIPNNLFLKKYESFESFVEFVKKKLGQDIVIDRPYKLCDYKPSYGYLFEPGGGV